jgi:hypothetical protein
VVRNMAATPSKASVARLSTIFLGDAGFQNQNNGVVINGQDTRWPHSQDGRATLPAVPDNAPQFFRVRAPD